MTPFAVIYAVAKWGFVVVIVVFLLKTVYDCIKEIIFDE